MSSNDKFFAVSSTRNASIATGAFILLILLSLAGGNNSGSSGGAKIENAANIGDTVQIRNPGSTIMCADRMDASKVYMAGELAMRQTFRLENSVSKAVDAEFSGRKAMMRDAYSCQWAPRDDDFVVTAKNVSGDDAALFHTVSYCLQPTGRNTCWWIDGDYRDSSPFTNVRSTGTPPQSSAQPSGEPQQERTWNGHKLGGPPPCPGPGICWDNKGEISN